MGFNPAVAFELVRTAAERGDAESQAYLGFRLAMGIYPPLPGIPHTAAAPMTCTKLHRKVDLWPGRPLLFTPNVAPTVPSCEVITVGRGNCNLSVVASNRGDRQDGAHTES